MSESDADRLRGEIEELFADLWQVPRFAAARGAFRPQLDCFRTEEPPTLTIVVDLAGVDPAEIRLDALPRALSITGERRRPRIGGRVYQLEIDCGRFERRVALPEDVDTGAASATYRDGLLTIVLPVAPERHRGPVHVPIEVSAQP